MLPFLLALPAPAAPEQKPDEEIVVYGDDFARWDRTRWWVQSELVLPSGLLLAAENNLSFKTHALQVRAVVACDKDAKLSGRKWEVSCEIEDVGLLVTSTNDWRPQQQERVQAVLDQVDARLGGSKVQLQVDIDGGITNFDIEGLSSDNLRERQIQETFRTLVTMVMAGFHLKIPDHAQRDGQWTETHTELMDIPSLTAARGSTMVVHQSSPYGEDRLVQSLGEGTVAVAIPYVGTDAFHHSWLIESQESVVGSKATITGTGFGQVRRIEFPPPADTTPIESSLSSAPAKGEQREMELEATWSMNLSGVAIFQRSTGIMTERVWACSGTPTAGSAGGAATGPYLNLGRLWMLGADERPSVGPTKQVAWPGQQMAGLDPWVALDL